MFADPKSSKSKQTAKSWTKELLGKLIERVPVSDRTLTEKEIKRAIAKARNQGG
jgi:hypothetical protein